MSDEWKNKLAEGYKNDHVFRKFCYNWKKYVSKSKKGGDGCDNLCGHRSQSSRTTRDDSHKESIDTISNPTGESIEMTPTEDPLSTEEALDVGSLEQFVDQQKDEKKMVTDGTFSLIDGVLYFSERKNSHLRLCIPRSMMSEVLPHNHDLLSHPGIHRTYSTLHLRYYIPKMPRVVKHYVNECAVCQTSKPSNESSLGPLIISYSGRRTMPYTVS